MAPSQPKSGLFVGINKGHVVTKRELPPRPSDRKGVRRASFAIWPLRKMEINPQSWSFCALAPNPIHSNRATSGGCSGDGRRRKEDLQFASPNPAVARPWRPPARGASRGTSSSYTPAWTDLMEVWIRRREWMWLEEVRRREHGELRARRFEALARSRRAASLALSNRKVLTTPHHGAVNSLQVNAEYGAVKDLAPDQGRAQGKGAAAAPSTALALTGTQDTKDARREGGSNAIIPAPLMLPKAPESSVPGKNTTVLSIPGSSDRFSTSALMERLPSRWPKPVWHAPWKNYRATFFHPNVISGHLGWVRSIAFDPGNEWFCTGSADRTIKIWDLASGTLKLTLTGHIEQVRGLAVSQRHTYLFSAGDDKQVKCWDLEQNKVIRSYHGHLSGVYCLALHPTIDVLLTGGRDSVCRVWDIRTKAHVSALTGHDNTVCSVFARPTDPQVVTGSHDTTIKFWDLVAGKTMCTLTHHKKSVRAMALHPKEKSFASASADNIKKFSLPKGEFLHNMLSQQKTILNAMAVNEDGVLATAGDNGSMWFWDWKSGHNFQQEQTIVQPGSLESEACIYALSYDNSGSRLVTCEADKTIKMWKEDLSATPETHPVNFKPPKDIRRY